MDQVYIPKNRNSFNIGDYVVIKLLGDTKSQTVNVPQKLCFYDVENIEPIKLKIIQELIKIIDDNIVNYGNIIITGSFLERGFNFNDVDILMITDKNINTKLIENLIAKKIGIKAHIIVLSNKEMAKGLETDPLYKVMLSRCVAKKKFIYRQKRVLDYKLLDLHLLESKVLIDNFDILTGSEKFKLTRNMTSIFLYINGKKITNESIDKEIARSLGAASEDIRQNILNKKAFLKRYNSIYYKTFNKIIRGIRNGSKQK